MPFINGRYHVNPVMGEALEAAREAEAALAALENRAHQNPADPTGAANDDFRDASGSPADTSDGPIHRVEIEAAEMVPANSGRAVSGYVARVHRKPLSGSAGAGVSSSNGRTGKIMRDAETHVFADHRDLVTFLRDELAKDAPSRR